MLKIVFFIVSAVAFSLFNFIHISFAQDGSAIAYKLDIDNLQVNLNYLWVLLAAALVFIMQAGFMCVESGLATAKNSINVAIKNLADFVLASILFWLVGFGLMFGISDNGLIGTSDFMMNLKDPWQVLFFVFQAVFVGTAATIDSGAVAGRTKFGSYLVISALVSVLIYPVFGHWAWGSLLHGDAAAGWLENMGFIDFAGSTVVHSVGGWVALAGCIVIGPRIEKYGPDGQVNSIPPHNMTLAYLGTFILFFGWFGFNCGSTLEVSPDIAGIAMNTLLSASFGCLSASILSWINSPFKRPEGEMIANGVLGGLVGITAGCAFVETSGAAMIGISSGIIVYFSTRFIERVLKVDDVVGAIAVHGVCGAWGTIAVGLFITQDHLGDVSRLHQIYIQSIGVLSCFVWSFFVAYFLLKTVDKFMGGMRVSKKDELIGLNIAEHGARSTMEDLSESMKYATRNGDFSDKVKVEVEIGTDIGDLCYGFNKMVDAIQKALVQTKKQIQMAEKAKNQAEGAEKSLSENRTQYEKRIQKIAGNLTRMMGEIEFTMSSIGTAAQTVQMNVDTLSSKSGEIDHVLQAVERIAFSTKLLASNAMIQAAHAGKAGDSFAVVAGEMAEVAKKTQEASQTIAQFTEEIKTLLFEVIKSINNQIGEIKDGNSRVDKAGKLIKELI
ncbi:MAG: ammonium transporter [Desulfobacteraceae bacterium]|nr:ammonium transporter [Desulfobacteraceae bacterium]